MGKKVNISTSRLMRDTMGTGRRKRAGKSQGKKTRKAQSRAMKEAQQKREEATGPQPRTFVFRRGSVGSSVKTFEMELRRMLLPNTALNLKERKSNTLKDFTDAAVQLGVSHLLCLSQGSGTGNMFLRIGRVPRGPTLTFAVHSFSLMADVQALRHGSKYALSSGSAELRSPPLVVLSNFSAGGKALRLAGATLQNMFPAINLDTIKLKECRRVVLFVYDAERDAVLMRHYLITAAPSGINRNLRRIVQGKGIPADAIRNSADIADFVLGPAAASESEASDMEDCKVALPQNFAGHGNVAAASPCDRSTVRLVELGPRMEFSVFRVQEGLFDGQILMGTKETISAKAEASRVKKARDAAEERRSAELEKKKREETRVLEKLAKKSGRAQKAVELKKKELASLAGNAPASKRGTRPDAKEVKSKDSSRPLKKQRRN